MFLSFLNFCRACHPCRLLTCRCCTRGGLVLFAVRLPCLWFTFLPPSPRPRSQSALPLRGRGRPRLFHARGFAPCISATEPARHWGMGANHAPGGGRAPARHLFALPPCCLVGGCAFLVACQPCLWFTFLPLSPPPPSPPGKGAGGIGGRNNAKSRVGRRGERHAPAGNMGGQGEPTTIPCAPPQGTADARRASAARSKPRGCKGRSPLHKKTLILPLPRWGRGAGG